MSPTGQLQIVETLSYPAEGASTEGVFTPIVGDLVSLTGANSVDLTEAAGGRRLALLFRRGATRVLRLSLVRRTGRCVVELAGMDPGRILAAMRLCREHFDGWFGISPERLAATDPRGGSPGDESRRRHDG